MLHRHSMGPQDLRDKRALIVCFKLGAQSRTGITVSGVRMQESFNVSFFSERNLKLLQ